MLSTLVGAFDVGLDGRDSTEAWEVEKRLQDSLVPQLLRQTTADVNGEEDRSLKPGVGSHPKSRQVRMKWRAKSWRNDPNVEATNHLATPPTIIRRIAPACTTQAKPFSAPFLTALFHQLHSIALRQTISSSAYCGSAKLKCVSLVVPPI